MFIAIFCILYHIFNYNCIYFNYFDNYLRFLKTHKPYYKRLNILKQYRKINTILDYKNTLFCKEDIIFFHDIKQLITFINNRISKIKIKYRSVGINTIIDNVSNVLINESLLKSKACIFTIYKKYYQQLKIKKKENNVFKLLLIKNLIIKIAGVKAEIDNIVKLIKKSKTANYIHFNKNIINNSTKVVSICCYNKNSSTLLYPHQNKIKDHILTFKTHLNKLMMQVKLLQAYIYVLTK